MSTATQNGHSANGVAPDLETQDPEIELLAIMRHCKGTIARVCKQRDALTRADFCDPAAGAIYGAAAIASHDMGIATAADVREMLESWAREYNDDAPMAAQGIALWDALQKPDIAPDDAKSRALDLAHAIRKAVASTREVSTNANGANALTLTRRAPAGHTGAALLDLELPEPKWAVDGIIPEGVSLIVGPPKIGKSWLTLSTCIAVATGGRALGSIKVDQGDALYLALEDNTRRLKSRLQKVLECEQTRPRGLENLHLFTEWERINEGGLERLNTWMEEHPNTRLIVIDTLEKIRPGRKGGGSIYADDYAACEALKHFADKYGVAVLIVHHTRKGTGDDAVEAVSGSYGLTGGVDGVLTLKRDRGRSDASLFITGRDVTEQDLALKWDADLCLWSILGDADEYRMSTQRANVANALRDSAEPITPKEIAEATGMKPESVRQFLYQMRKANQVMEAGGKYSLRNQSVSAVSDVSNVSVVSPVSAPTLLEMPPPSAREKGNANADSEAYQADDEVTI